MEVENNIWKGTPSQWMNFMFYICCVILIVVFGLGLILALWKFLDTKYNKVTITDQRIIEKRGILSISTNQLELYRVKDIRLEQPLILRIFGLSNIILTTSDSTDPLYILKGIEEGNTLTEKIRIAVDRRRDVKGVKELDFH
ncbi:PH domain-containing protein [uncultured Aquimarina sp.]|uniref:PH domain-containing protein n=1 Tax=uncultured Aquimarina sp. TaxID=575652 RepID=UPI00261810C4|nr:PH domain-containing protein [uncultured Aquimarina sp.]